MSVLLVPLSACCLLKDQTRLAETGGLGGFYLFFAGLLAPGDKKACQILRYNQTGAEETFRLKQLAAI